ncbi:hypothetical protein QUB80_09585 [Chlorogloeopsis sp. ULAP01]|uniref:hypothetical protein n=1 Tax=Chlorogloeopsis sp. ULAP01 TaxID=3056483 RepID=UPI0025AB0CB6|nr:hypothetical protein [Chlorogloeopsis sp. ULAP01]MDM9380955.1 hypothetical protein [Chlorogloeopsis sp. ULAP01]
MSLQYLCHLHVITIQLENKFSSEIAHAAYLRLLKVDLPYLPKTLDVIGTLMITKMWVMAKWQGLKTRVGARYREQETDH